MLLAAALAVSVVSAAALGDESKPAAVEPAKSASPSEAAPAADPKALAGSWDALLSVREEIQAYLVENQIAKIDQPASRLAGLGKKLAESTGTLPEANRKRVKATLPEVEKYARRLHFAAESGQPKRMRRVLLHFDLVMLRLHRQLPAGFPKPRNSWEELLGQNKAESASPSSQ